MTDKPAKPYVLPEEEQYFGFLTDELPGIQVEATLDLPSRLDADSVPNGLLTYFNSSGSELNTFVTHSMSTTQRVQKFSSGAGNFSVVHLQNGAIVLKSKSKREKRHGVRIAMEHRTEASKGESPENLAAEALLVPDHSVSLVGELVRDKERIAVENPHTGRVYVVTLDRSKLVDVSWEPVLNQLAIEYKGTIPKKKRGKKGKKKERAADRKTVSADKGAKGAKAHKDASLGGKKKAGAAGAAEGAPVPTDPAPDPLDDIVRDIRTIRVQARRVLRGMAIPATPAKETKTEWVRQTKETAASIGML